MPRIVVILLLFILLTEAPHVRHEPPIPRADLVLEVSPQVVEIDNSLRGYGPLRLYNLWKLSSDNSYFGGISSLLVGKDGRFLALSDTGEYFDFGIAQYDVTDHIAALPRRPDEFYKPHWQWDSESMVRDPASGRIWVGFERLQRICRYSSNFERLERCVSPPALRAWPATKSIESMVRFSDGRFLAIQEQPENGGPHDVLLWSGDPVEPGTPPPVHLSYTPPEGYLPTDALWLGGDRMLVLNRRLSLKGFSAKLVLVTLPPLKAGVRLSGLPVADFGWPQPSDNMEAMALSRDDNGPVLWVASDDNHLFAQKTLLFSFALPRGWVVDRVAPGAPPSAANAGGPPEAAAPSAVLTEQDVENFQKKK